MKHLALITTFFFILLIGTARAQGEPDLKTIMVDLGADMEAIVHALNYDDFEAIEAHALAIANHKKPPMTQRKQIMALLGEEMEGFKRGDTFVHNAALKVAEDAALKEHEVVIKSYAILLHGCAACHTGYRARIVQHLKESK